MTSQLASQLQRLQQKPADAIHRPIQSFLFSTQDANSFSREQIHQLALSGLQTLTAMDNRFHSFIGDLFDAKRTRQERAMLTSAEDATLRSRLDYLFALLSPHLFLTAAQQVVEFLVRVYEVHIYDAAAVLRTFLPYHDHNIFARMVLLLDLRDTGLDFLSTNRLRGAPLLREQLVLACVESRKVARLVCLTMAMPFRYEVRHHAANALFAGVVSQLATHKDAEALWRTFLPFVLELLSGAMTGAEAGTAEGQRHRLGQDAASVRSRVSQESVATALVVLATWCSHVTFSSAMLRTVVKPILQYFSAVTLNENHSGVAQLSSEDMLCFLEVIFSTQSGAMADAAMAPQLNLLFTMPWRTLSPHLPNAESTELTNMKSSGGSILVSSPRHSALLAILLSAAVEQLTVAPRVRLVSSDVVEFLLCAAEDLPLSNAMASHYLRTLMTAEAAITEEDAAEDRQFYNRVVTALERRYSVVFDAVLSQVLSNPETSAAASSFLTRHLSGSRYSMVEVRSAVLGATESLPLFACLLHPVAEVRTLGAKTLTPMPLKTWMGVGGGEASAMPSGDSPQRNQSLVDLLAHVASYESSPTVAVAFLEAGAAVMALAVKEVSSSAHSKSGVQINNMVAAMVTLMRSFYEMVLSSLTHRIEVKATEAQRGATRRVVMSFITSFLGPALSSLVPRAEVPAKQLREAIIYYITVTYTVLQAESTRLDAGLVEAAVVELDKALHPAFPTHSASLLARLSGSVALATGSDASQRATKAIKANRKALTGDSDSEDEQPENSTAPNSAHLCASDLHPCEPLIQVIFNEAKRRFSHTLDAVYNATSIAASSGKLPATDARLQTSVVEMELLVALSVTLQGGTKEVAHQTSKLVLEFLCGSKTATSSKPGYLNLLISNALQEDSRETRKVGRGSKDAITTAMERLKGYGLVKGLARVASLAMHHALNEADTDLALDLAKMLGYLGAPLPNLGVNTHLLAILYFKLLSEEGVTTQLAVAEETASLSPVVQQVDWDRLVTEAVYTTPTTAAAGPSPSSGATPSLAALALVLLLPLRSRGESRRSLLRVVQDAVLSTSGNGKGRRDSAASAVLRTAMRLSSSGPTKLSVTALSCLIECMAVEDHRYLLTDGASELLCSFLMEKTVPLSVAEASSEASYVVPTAWATEVVRYFYSSRAEVQRSGPLKGAEMQRTVCLISRLLPRISSIVAPAVAASASKKGHKGASTSSTAPHSVSAAAVDFVETVCQRLVMWKAPASSTVEENASVQLAALLLQYPYLHMEKGGSRPVYRYALTALAVGLSQGVEDRQRQNSKVFLSAASQTRKKSGGTNSTSDSAAYQLDAAYQQQVAAYLQAFILRGVDQIGVDIATFCTSTIGGYEYVFLPLVDAAKEQASESREAVVPALRALSDMLEVMIPKELRSDEEGDTAASSSEGAAAARWRPPTSVAVAHPLTYNTAVRLLHLPQDCRRGGGDAHLWAMDAYSLLGLRLITTMVQLIPVINYRGDGEVSIDDSDDDEEQQHRGGESAFHFIQLCLDLYPLQGLDTLLRFAAVAAATEEEAGRVMPLPHRQRLQVSAAGSTEVEAVLQLITYLVRICSEQTRLLVEKVPDAVYRLKSRLLREVMMLMGSALITSDADESDRQGPHEEEGAELAKSKLSFNVETIACLLRVTAPLLQLPTHPSSVSPTTHASAQTSGDASYLHIPLVSLLIRLEAVENTEALGFRTALEVCQDILSSFDVGSQMQCLSQLMRLVSDPAGQLTASGSEEASDTEQTLHLLRRMVKPNQVINRQEAILHLINLTVKSDAFLEPFLALQRRSQSTRGGRKKAGQKTKSKGDDEEEDEEEDEPQATVDGDEAAQQAESTGCMKLLVSALELFSHYHDLNEKTSASASGEETGAYTILLEVLSGNTLACILAGINEPTFIVCQKRLLDDPRAALRRIGLEVLLDRLHHSLPTLENVLSDEAMEEHRRRLRDPRERLTLMDLVRVKARPLTTKRSTQLFPLLVRQLKASVDQVSAYMSAASPAEKEQKAVKASGNTASVDSLLTLAQLSTACFEELTRIVSGGGSTQAEKTLLNVNRSKRVTESALVKQFGGRARVDEVHAFVVELVDKWMPQVTRCEQQLRATTSSSAPFYAGAEVSILSTMTCLLTALATITQVMGVAFMSIHCLQVLHTVVSALVYEVVELPTVVARQEAGALLRHTALSCLIRCFPACWQMSGPHLPSILYAVTHLTNTTDAESHYLCTEVLTVLEAVMESQLLLEAGTTCLQGIPYVNGAVVPASEQHRLFEELEGLSSSPASKTTPRHRIKVEVGSHSFAVLFGCIERRVQTLKKEELTYIPTMIGGTTPQNNIWLAALQSLASTTTIPSSDVVMPVLEAFSVFLLKFKAKHCGRLIRMVADWAFGDSSPGGVVATNRQKVKGISSGASESDDDDEAGRGHTTVAQSMSRTTLQSWVLFFALVNHLLSKLGSIFDFAFPVVLPHVITVLRTYCVASGAVMKGTDSLVALALEGALLSVREMSLAQTPGPDYDYSIPHDVYFATAEVFTSVMPALVRQLHNMQCLTDSVHDYTFRVQYNVVPAIRAFMACLGSSKLQSKTQAEIVRELRHPSRQVRREALICLDGIYADGGDELASRLMAEMLPTVVELTEDRDDAVVEEARKLCNNLSHMTGQDVLYAMS